MIVYDRNKKFFRQLLLLVSLLAPFLAAAQSDVRSRIDIDRRSLSFDDEKTLQKSREFIRMDSTFYIGHMYDGAFKFYRASDHLGFEQAIVPLEKAMRLIEKDYDEQLRTRTSDVFTFFKVSGYQNDYCYIIYWLEQSYQNIERPDKAFEVLTHLRDRNLQYEQGVESYNMMAWIYHRNRVYTSAKYPFLKNSVEANDSMAHLYLDSSIIKINKDAEVNVGLFDASYINRQYYFTYHYKAILFDYELEIDSANFYYDILLSSGYYSSNNYAEFQYTLGEFATSDDYFREAESRDGSQEKRTREYFYMRSHLDIYRGDPATADTLLRKVIDSQGSTPGFGWHSIGLARALQYEGLTAESQKRLNKAANFAELHIGTTWGQEQYNLAVAAMNYTNKVHFREEYDFENDEWWFWLNPVNWYHCTRLGFQVQQHKTILATMVANNPERERVIYPLFTSENLMNFDEVHSVIEDFGNEYFIGIYKKLLETDKRPKLKKYFRYMLGRLYLAEGKDGEARRYFEEVLNDPEINDPYNKLLYARTCEGMALAAPNSDEKSYWTMELYRAFPQLIPFTELRMEFRAAGNTFGKRDMISGVIWLLIIAGILTLVAVYLLSRSGRMKRRPWLYTTLVVLVVGLGAGSWFWKKHSREADPVKAITDDLQNCKIDFNSNPEAPVVSFSFNQLADAMEITYSVRSFEGESMQEGILRVPPDRKEEAGEMLAYRLFGVRKKTIGEQPEPELTPKENDKSKKK